MRDDVKTLAAFRPPADKKALDRSRTLNRISPTARMRMWPSAGLLLCATLAAAPAHPTNADWDLFVRRHMGTQGRVIDDGSGGVSHSESQGVAMFLAVHYDDRPVFDRVWQWTKKHLQVRDDKLLAWLWSEAQVVADRNNATDGDLMVAWALLRAATRWNEVPYRNDGLGIVQTIAEKLTRRTERGLVLIPGNDGFETPGGPVLNLSYWVFPALHEIEQANPGSVWPELRESGHKLLREARFGRWSLPPDWLQVGSKLTAAEKFPPRFGYDAVRIPLYLVWSGADAGELQSFKAFWSYFEGARFLPAWVNLNDDSVDSHGAQAGIRAVAAVTAAYPDLEKVRLPALDDKDPYYSAALLLLTKVMLCERVGC